MLSGRQVLFTVPIAWDLVRLWRGRFISFSLFRMDAPTLRRKVRRLLRLAYAQPDRPRHRRDDPFRPPGKLVDAVLVGLSVFLGAASLF